MGATFGGRGSDFGGTDETGGFGGGAGAGGAGIFVSVDDAAIFGAVGTAFSPGFSSTGVFLSNGIDVRSGTSTLLGVAGTGFSTGGPASFAGGQLATPPSWTVPHQGQKVVSAFEGGGGTLATTGCTGGGLTGDSAGFSTTRGFSETIGFSITTACGLGGATDTAGCGACS